MSGNRRKSEGTKRSTPDAKPVARARRQSQASGTPKVELVKSKSRSRQRSVSSKRMPKHRTGGHHVSSKRMPPASYGMWEDEDPLHPGMPVHMYSSTQAGPFASTKDAGVAHHNPPGPRGSTAGKKRGKSKSAKHYASSTRKPFKPVAMPPAAEAPSPRDDEDDDLPPEPKKPERPSKVPVHTEDLSKSSASSSEEEKAPPEVITETAHDLEVNKRWKLVKRLVSYSNVFVAYDGKAQTEHAAKVEHVRAPEKLLDQEASNYKALGKCSAVPKIHWYGVSGNFKVLVMDRQGKSLGYLFDMCRRKFTMKTVVMLADLMVQKVQAIHEAGLVWNDVSADNFLMGYTQRAEDKGELYAINLAYAAPYIKGKKHVPMKTGQTFGGMARFVSLNAQNGCTTSRRDDLEAVGYILMYFLRGSLPWQGMRGNTTEAVYKLIREMKNSIPISELTMMFPPAFQKFLEHCRNLKFDQKPDYAYLRGLFKDLAKKQGFKMDYSWCWNEKLGSGSSSSSGSDGSSRGHRVPSNMVIDHKYLIERKLGNGVFADVHLARELVHGQVSKSGKAWAVKMESASTRDPQLLFEYEMYKNLASKEQVGIPEVKYYGTQDGYNVMVMQCLGRSLEDHYEACGNKLSLKTVLMLADQMITRLEYLHTKLYIHRDIKSENFMMGRDEHANTVFIIDYGLANCYISAKTNKHVPYRENRELIGTARFVSINTHKGYEKSRRDDMEEVGYIWAYFLRGSLPWQGLRMRGDSSQDLYDRIRDKKIETPLTELFKGFPKEFVTYQEYCRNLKYEEEPDYKYLRSLFRSLAKRSGIKYDNQWDWVIKANQANGKHR